MQNLNSSRDPKDIFPFLTPSLSVIVISNGDTISLENCIGSIQDFADQIIIVNENKNSDITERSNKYSDFDFYDFKEAKGQSCFKNFGLSKARCSWVLILEGNEVIKEGYISILGSLLRSQNVFCWYLPIFDHSLPDYGPEYQPRLFRNFPSLSYIGTVYEHPYNSLLLNSKKFGLNFNKGEVPIYVHKFAESPVLQLYEHTQLFKRLQIDIETYPNDPVFNFQLGASLFDHGQIYAAGEYFEKALNDYAETFGDYFDTPLFDKIITRYCQYLLTRKNFQSLRELLTTELPSMIELSDSLEYILAVSFVEEENWPKAVEHLNRCAGKSKKTYWNHKIHQVATNIHLKLLSSSLNLKKGFVLL